MDDLPPEPSSRDIAEATEYWSTIEMFRAIKDDDTSIELSWEELEDCIGLSPKSKSHLISTIRKRLNPTN